MGGQPRGLIGDWLRFGYSKLHRQLIQYCSMRVLPFDEQSAEVFQGLKRIYPRLGTMDLKIASIAMSNEATLLSRNLQDFGQIEGLRVEDWAIAEKKE